MLRHTGRTKNLNKNLVNLYSMDLKYIYYIVFMVCIVSFFAGLLTHYLFNRD
jgi:hypothetical protein